MVVGQEVCQMASLIPGGRWESPKTTITYFSPGAKTGATLCLPSNPVTLTTDTSASFTNLFLENKVPKKKKKKKKTCFLSPSFPIANRRLPTTDPPLPAQGVPPVSLPQPTFDGGHQTTTPASSKIFFPRLHPRIFLLRVHAVFCTVCDKWYHRQC